MIANMKALTSFHRLAAATSLALALAVPAASYAESTQAAPAQLQISVHVPPTWRPFLADDIAEAFAYRVEDTFKRRGYTGGVAYVDTFTDPDPKRPHLEIRLTEWRINRLGQAECSFFATLVTPLGEKHLGAVHSTSLFWPITTGRWGIHRSFEVADALGDAADRALEDLYRRVARADLVPGLKPENARPDPDLA
jgi:hypothetical protein